MGLALAVAVPLQAQEVLRLWPERELDGLQAVKLIRDRAAEWGVDRERVGMLGVSAGGGVAIGALVTAQEDARPDFLISSFGPSLIDVEVPANKPPVFIAVRQFHPNVARALVALYQVWLEEAHAWMHKRGIVPTAEAAD